MTPQDQLRFYQALAAMGVYFSDELTKPRQKLYWDLLHEHLTIDEWEYACHQAMLEENFHKVPLVATLKGYVQTYRAAHRTQRQREERGDGAHTEAQLLQLWEQLILPSEVRALIESIWPEERKQT